MLLEFLPVLASIAGLIALSAFMKLALAALLAASQPRMKVMAQGGDKRAASVETLMRTPERLVTAVNLGCTFLDACAVALATALAMSVAGPALWERAAAIAIAVSLVTLAIVLLHDLLIKAFNLTHSDPNDGPNRVSLAVAPIMKVAAAALMPVVIGVSVVAGGLLGRRPQPTKDTANRPAPNNDNRTVTEGSQTSFGTQRARTSRLGGTLDLSDLQVLDVMVHRTKMETVNADDPPQTIVDEILKSQFTRVPVWKDEPENIIGILHTKDLLVALGRKGWDVAQLDIMKFAAKPWFVPDTTSVKDQLNQFIKHKQQQALVVDEYGEVQGLITLEDILEEIVGQIADEHDPNETAVRPQADGTVNVDGTLAIRDLNRQMDWNLPDEEATTIAGLVIHEAQMIPEPGQAFTFHGYRFEVLRKSRNKITALRIKPVPSERTPEGGENDAMAAG